MPSLWLWTHRIFNFRWTSQMLSLKKIGRIIGMSPPTTISPKENSVPWRRQERSALVPTRTPEPKHRKRWWPSWKRWNCEQKVMWKPPLQICWTNLLRIPVSIAMNVWLLMSTLPPVRKILLLKKKTLDKLNFFYYISKRFTWFLHPE